MTNKAKSFITWWDEHILSWITVWTIFFIPLYFKIPLKYLEYTYVKIRFDDIYIGLVILIFAIQLLRKKAHIPKQWLILFGLFWGSIIISHLVGRFLFINTYPNNNIALLHTLRRFEYMSLFFVAYNALRTKEDIHKFVHKLVWVTIIACVYGILQKYNVYFNGLREYCYHLSLQGGALASFWNTLSVIFSFPALQTMNPEFARGHLLTLTPDARVSSTFAGHYDLAAFLVFVLPLIIAQYAALKKYYVGMVSYALGIFVIFLTSSRVSFIAMCAGLGAFFISQKKYRLLFITILLILLFGKLTASSTSMASRFAQTIQKKNVLVKQDGYLIPQEATTSALPAGGAFIGTGSAGMLSEKEREEALKQIKQEIIKNSKGPLDQLTLDKLAQQRLSEFTTQSVTTLDTSLSVRFSVSWPRALAALQASPLFGKGAFSITEATDGDYMRSLGEFGIVGTGIFGYILWSLIARAYRAYKKSPYRYLYAGYIAGVIGLLINAVLIDVFEASKVAYIFWLVSGLFMKHIQIASSHHEHGHA